MLETPRCCRPKIWSAEGWELRKDFHKCPNICVYIYVYTFNIDHLFRSHMINVAIVLTDGIRCSSYVKLLGARTASPDCLLLGAAEAPRRLQRKNCDYNQNPPHVSCRQISIYTTCMSHMLARFKGTCRVSLFLKKTMFWFWLLKHTMRLMSSSGGKLLAAIC